MSISVLLSIILAILSASRIIWFMPGIGNAYYVVLLAVLAILLCKGIRQGIKISVSGYLLIGVTTLSIVFNDIPDIFQPWMRLGLFCTLILLVGPFCRNKLFADFRIVLFWLLQISYVIIALISFVGRFWGISRVQGNYWCGITNHSILLGIVSGNACIFLLSKLLSNGKKTKNERWFLGVIFATSLLVMLGASSRAAIISCLSGTFVYLFISLRKRRASIVKWAFVSSIVLYFISPYITHYTIGIREKNKGELLNMNISSRAGIWELAWNSFLDNPVIGTGFATMKQDTDEYSANTETGQIEPGSSWLAVLSMTGLLGAIAIMIVIIQSMQDLKALCQVKAKKFPVLCSYLIFYLMHMCGEGYIYAGGSMACFNFWLVLGAIQAEAQRYSIWEVEDSEDTLIDK